MTASRAYSTLELQAAAQALLTGVFAPASTPQPNDLAALAADTEATLAFDTSLGVVADLGPLVRVVPASAGAGASTVAVAIADAADAAGEPVRLLDAASAAWSGLLPVTSTELGVCDGWRQGRRGRRVLVERLDLEVHAVSAVPLPRPAPQEAWTVLDVGWGQRELAAAHGHWAATAPAQVEVVAGRLTEKGLHQVEWTLRRLALARTVVVLTGTYKVRSPDLLAAGPLLRDLHAAGRVVGVPLLAKRTFPGLGPHELPKPLRAAGELLHSEIKQIADLPPPAPSPDRSPVRHSAASPTL